ncbi:MAG TPA: segregation/condensation protein A [Blastocatellia bacterium]|nr:segregation/condensation protein A [Blastocatellia bacterium]
MTSEEGNQAPDLDTTGIAGEPPCPDSDSPLAGQRITDLEEIVSAGQAASSGEPAAQPRKPMAISAATPHSAQALAAEPPAADKSAYRVKLEIFEGPLDLLLYLIRKEEVSIYDIPIARITEQYLDYLQVMKELDIGVAGEFLLMAATLIHIKSQTLLPRDPDVQEDQVEDPLKDLVQQLLEHQKFKAAANALYQRSTIEREAFPRAALETDGSNPEIASTIFQLFEVFREVLNRQRAIVEMEIVRDEVTMAEKITEIKTLVAQNGEVSARRIFERARTRREMVLTFLGILELVKELVLRLVQTEVFGDIILTARVEPDSPLQEAGTAQ